MPTKRPVVWTKLTLEHFGKDAAILQILNRVEVAEEVALDDMIILEEEHEGLR